MKTNLSPVHAFVTRGAARLIAVLWLGGALLVAGCVSTTEVANIVVQSNAALVASQLGGLGQKPDGASAADWHEANAQIEAFIAAHPDQPATTAPLRVRQALLLLANNQSNLAKAAFDSVAPGDLHTDRDKALKNLQDHLLWWFGVSTAATWSESDHQSARNARAALKAEYAGLERSPEIRDYLAEMCAWVGLANARQATTREDRRALFEETLNDYVKIFTEKDRETLKMGVARLAGLNALTSDMRRCMRGEIVLGKAREFNVTREINAHLNDGTFQRLIEAQPPSP